MKRKLIARPRAELDLIKHFVYLAERNPRIAQRFKLAVKSAIAAIAADPLSSATVHLRAFPELELRFKRPRGYKNFLIYFQVTDDAVVILRVLHSSQDANQELRG